MKNYYLKELYVIEGSINTGGEKARDDFECILGQLGFQALLVDYGNLDRLEKLSRQKRIYDRLKAAFSTLNEGDVLFIQYPFLQMTALSPLLFRLLEQKHVRYVILLHDVESERHSKRVSTSPVRRLKTLITDTATLKNASRIILLNPLMVRAFADKGVSPEKLITMDVFDYLLPNFNAIQRKGKTGKGKPVIIASNLRPYKSTYAYHLPDNCRFNLYGTGFTGEVPSGSRYFGAFRPEELPRVMEGSFGLVWDGESVETCTGVFGEYLKLNGPHKVSLYLASGLPVAIWSQAAKAEFIVKHKLGIAVDSLYELRKAIDSLSDEDYAEMVQNAKRLGAKIRAGFNTRNAVRRCLEELGVPTPIETVLPTQGPVIPGNRASGGDLSFSAPRK